MTKERKKRALNEVVKLYEPTSERKGYKYTQILSKRRFDPSLTVSGDLSSVKDELTQLRDNSLNSLTELIKAAEKNFDTTQVEFVYVDNVGDFIDFIKRFARSRTIVKTQSETVNEVEQYLLKEGYEIVDTFKEEYRLDETESNISNSLYTPAERFPAVSLESVQEKPLFFTKGEVRDCTALIGVNAVSVEPPEIHILQHYSNIGRVLRDSRDLIFLAGVDKLVPDRDCAALQTRLCSLFGLPPIASWEAEPKTGSNFEDLGRISSDRRGCLVLLNNGRTDLLNSDNREVLRCLSCRSCLSHCPAYGYFSKSNRKRNRFPLADMGDIVTVVKFNKITPQFSENLWTCSTCGMCNEVCPVSIDILGLWEKCRGIVVESGRVPAKVREALESTYLHGNPWQYPKSERTRWMEGVSGKINLIDKGAKAEVLYYVGCLPSFDRRAMEIARSIATILNVANVDFGVLGEEEKCCGNEILRIGERGLFDELARENVNLFNMANVKCMVTTSPHCYNVFKNEYPSLNFEIMHYTSYFLKLLVSGRLPFNNLKMNAIFHDPCYLGRHNGIYEDARNLLKKIGIELHEFRRNRVDSVCCGGGGGRMWTEETLNELVKERVREAIKMGVDVIITACPFCHANFDEAVKVEGVEEKVSVMDVAEVLREALP